MGDGGVACVPLQPIMEKFPGSETFGGGGGGGGGGSSSNGKMESNGNSKVFKRRTTKRMKLKRDAFFKKEENQEQKPQQKTELVTEKVKSSGEVENGKEEVEEGELGTLRSPPKREVENGEVTPETASKNEVERGEIVSDKWRREEVVGVERYDFGGGRFRGDHYVQRRERTPEKYRRGEYEKTDFGGTWRGSKDEVEKGEFIPDRWQKGGGDGFREEYGYLKGRRHDSSKERERRYDWTPPRYSSEDVSPGREYSRIGTGNHRHCKRTARWEVSQERSYAKGSMKNVDELAYKNDYSYGRSSQGREQHPTSHGSRLKRYGTESEGSDRKPYDDHGEYVSSKSRRLSNSEHYSRQSGDKPFRSVNSSRSLSDRLSVRHYDDAATRAAAYDRQRRSPSYSDRSPHERGRQQDHRDRTPARHERSPVYRSYRHDSRNRSPSYVEKSPNDRVKAHERRERSPSHSGSSVDRSRQCNHRQTNRNEVSEIKHHDKIKEEKLSVKESTVPSKDPLNVHEMQNGAVDKGISHEIHAKDESQGACLEGEEQPSLVNGVVEELPSMEEDMDICDTPPHVPCVANANLGKWYYIDHFGEERGPSRLCDLKALIDGGILMSDHLVKHSDSDRWVTVENAASPVVAANFTTVFSEAVTQLVSPPEAPGNVLMEAGDIEHCVDEVCRESIDAFGQGGTGLDDCLPRDDLDIDDRVGALLDGVTVLPGKELEIVGEVLQMTFDQSGWERFGISEGILQDYSFSQGPFEQSQQGDLSKFPDTSLKDAAESTSTASVDKECSYLFSEFTEWFSDRWSCKGGDWQRNEEAVQDKHFRKKLVLNDGYPLCQMPKIGCEDPRWQRKDDLYYPSQSKKLDLPPWAFSWPDERIDSSVVNKMGQAKPVALRGIKGSMMPVIRINACVVKDQGSSVSDSRLKPRVKEKYPSKGTKHYSLSNDVKKSSEENVIHSKSFNEEILDGSLKSGIFSKPKDRLWTVNDMQLQLGEWYYLDGTGHEHGPFSSSALPKLVEEGFLKKQSSVFRKMDSIWVPVTSVIKASEKDCRFVGDNNVVVGESSEASSVLSGCSSISGSFHSLHPHFIGYTLGKLHELVMKSYKSREFAAAVNEVLDPWINSRQTRKEMEKHRSSLYLQKLPMDYGVSVFENDMHGKKRCWTLLDGVDEDDEMAEGLPPLYVEPSFEDLCGNVSFCKKESHCSGTELQSWGLLDGHILARIFHFLRTDVKSLVFASSTCKHWRTAVGFYKNISVRIDLSTMGSVCTDSVIGSILGGYNKQMIKVLTLDGCINVTSAVLEGILQSFSHISSIDIRGCSQFEELMIKYPHVNWVKGRTSQGMRTLEDSNAKLRSLKQMPAQSSSFSKLGHVSCMDESSGLKDYFDMVEKRGAANQAFRQNLYKRTKVVDARKSSVLARDARMRHLAMKKAGNGYRRMEEFLVLSLQDIMKGNISDYFVRKVAEIENKIKSGYYARRGLSSAKQDIIKMCREAIKMKKRGDGGDMEHVIPLFIKLGTRLDESFKIAIDRDEMKKQRDEASGSSGYRKFKTPSDRKYTSRTSNGGFDYLESSPDRDVKKNLTRINKKTDLDSESSDEFELSSDDDVSGSGSASDTESDSDVRSGVTFEPKEEYFTAEEAFDLTPEDREWGARMTKASLVPPVTRKYEVIDQYVIVADEAEVQRKMQVSLPEDYEDKVKAQKNGSEEVDMEIPEVKEYKPRKQLGQEVIEQEVYGIDPYTHNLLLDSMRDDVDWTLAEKHVFIEDTILRVLNKQVRSYTGSGNTPMKYPLKPVIEELLGIAKQDNNMRTWKLCEGLLHAIDGRPEDNYVAYRKGLGVVCDKEAGFTEDDFVVEFLGEVYPAWKWFEKQDGIRCLQKNSKEPAPEFYNIYLERPKGDADGYDLVVVDAMHKANYASRICHSCRPNCEAKVTAVSGQYQIGIYSVRPIGFGEEITFDYNSVTESKEEYEASVCLCGSQVCRGSYLNLTGEGAFQKVLKEWHGLLDKHRLLLESCELNWVSEEDYIELGKAGLGSCLLGGLPDWLIAYSARLVRFINFERTKLPEEILSHNLEEKKKYCADISLEMERSDAEIQAEGVYNQRLQNLALTLDKVRYVLRNVFGDPKEAPPPLQKLSPEEMVSVLWNGEDSLVDQLLQCIAQHVDDQTLQELKYEIRAHDPSTSGNVEKSLRKSLLWLRDEVRNLPCTYKSRHDAAADLIHIYAYTKSYFKIREYKSLTSPPVHISPHDLGPKCADKLAGVTEYCKTYGENYCLGQLIYWHNQANTDPDRVLVRASKGCLSLPDIGSFYAKAQKPSRQRIYGPRTVRFMLARMEKQPQRPWPKDRIWSFSSSPKIFGSPMLDAVLNNTTLEREMVIWLKNRPAIFQAMWDR